ncbi:MAG: SRPBCC family protein [Chitinophagaceae bacterium]
MIVLYVILGIIALLLVAGLLISKDLKATKEVVINKPAGEVFNYIKYLKNQDNFSKWGSLDPAMKKSYTGTDATVGFVSAWEGNKKVGQGEQEIKAIQEGSRVDYEIRFIKPFRSVAKSTLTTEAKDAGSTKVTWGFEGKMNYPMNVMKLFMNMEKSIGNDFATGLNNLKTLLEK